jgi:hypothetical protein
MTKICKKCGIEKELSEFHKASNKINYQSECKVCQNERCKAYKKGIRCTFKMDIPKYKFCKWCRAEINTSNTEQRFLKDGYCGEWCREIENPPKIFHLCICGNSINPWRRKNGISSGMYPKKCEECIRKYTNPLQQRINDLTLKSKNDIIVL